jgi:hypothetical protein
LLFEICDLEFLVTVEATARGERPFKSSHGAAKSQNLWPWIHSFLETSSVLFFSDTYIVLIVDIVKAQLLFLESIADPLHVPWAGTGLESIPQMKD